MIKKINKIALIGMPGVGKTTTARECCKLVDMQCIDLDDFIVANQGMPITQIFEQHGELKFRQLECDTIKLISSMDNTIVATGGGVVLNPQNMQQLNNHNIVFLDCDINVLYARLKNDTNTRPLLQDGLTCVDKNKLQLIYDKRIALYNHYADIIIDTTTLSIQDVVKRIIEIIDRH